MIHHFMCIERRNVLFKFKFYDFLAEARSRKNEPASNEEHIRQLQPTFDIYTLSIRNVIITIALYSYNKNNKLQKRNK